MKNILLLTDFSQNSENAINYALAFFKKEYCKIFVMHVHKMGSFTSDDLMISSSTDTIHDSLVQKPKKKLNSLILKIQKRFDNDKHKFETIVDFDDFTDAINQAIELHDIDIIVLGSNGKTGAKEIIFGSNTINVIRKVLCPTMVIPEGYIYKPVTEVLLPLSHTDDLHGKALAKLGEFIEEYELTLNVLRINPQINHSDYEFYDQSNLAILPHDYFVINDVPVQFATHSFIQIKKIGLTAVFAHKEKLIERFFKGSSTSKISNLIKTPLLVYHND